LSGAQKPPPQRVSLSAAGVRRTHAALFLVDGEAKREAVARWRAGDALPARAIRPPAGVDVLLEASLLM
jgi:6-phosphogluconolactonase